jgi:hypothetical protein
VGFRSTAASPLSFFFFLVVYIYFIQMEARYSLCRLKPSTTAYRKKIHLRVKYDVSVYKIITNLYLKMKVLCCTGSPHVCVCV